MRSLLRILLLASLSMALVGCGKKSSDESSIEEDYKYLTKDILNCNSVGDEDCLKDIQHIGFRRDGTMYIWRKDDLFPSTICQPGLGDVPSKCY